MLVAIVSDIHGNRHALEAVLADVASVDATSSATARTRTTAAR